MNKTNYGEKKVKYGDHEVFLERGLIARQADAAVLATIGETSVLATVVYAKESNPEVDFFPLTVNYQEKSYASGQIPGGFFKREGRASESEVLTSRLIDRPIRPLFPDSFKNETQIILQLISVDPNYNPDIISIIAASAALSVSGAPFQGPISAARVGYIDNEYVLNPSVSQLKDSKLDLVVAGTKDAVLMVESEASGLSEEVMLGAVEFGHKHASVIIDAIDEFKQESGNPEFQLPEVNKELSESYSQIAEKFRSDLEKAYLVTDKIERKAAITAIKKSLVDDHLTEEMSKVALLSAFSCLEKDIVRTRLLRDRVRIDGRSTTDIRNLSSLVGLFRRTHGSAIFTRGETQSMAIATLGSDKDAQLVEAFGSEYRENFIFHYNFPPYCVGEVGQLGAVKRREIGHGNLAKRSLKHVLPSKSSFPYTIRVVSEIMESNGSSSMASVCSASLALMDAGVPIKESVAGVAMGLVKESDDYVILSDILGDEDHLGDMDFKVAGTFNGVTALQMDIKISGISFDIMRQALDQAKDARIHILESMNDSINKPRSDISSYAPRITSFKINPDKIRDLIGKGGSNIRSLTDETGVAIEIEDDGTVKISSSDTHAADIAIKKIKAITTDVEVGSIYDGKISRVTEYGAFVNILPGKDGLLHISQVSNLRVENINDYCSVGQSIKVKVIAVDKQGRIKLSMKDFA